MPQSHTARGAPRKRISRKLAVLLLGSALALHLSIVITMSLVGTLGILPTTIDNNGVGISFALDSTWNRYDAANLSLVLKRRGIIEWLKYPAPFHTKLYSLSFAIFDPWSDFSILTAEPVNAGLYLLILILVYKIGAEVCDPRSGILAAGLVAAWPSFLLHTTQFLREPQMIAATLVLVFVAVRSLTRRFSWLQAMVAVGLCGLSLAVVWLIRAEMWELFIAILAFGATLLVTRQVLEKRLLATNVLCFALLFPIVLAIPRALPRFLSWQVQERTTVEPSAALPGTPSLGLANRITSVRQRYYHLPAGSNVDSNVQLQSTRDIIEYLPRAAEIGFLSPFPNMWFESGANVGRSGRLLSGMETALIYLIEILAMITVRLRRKQLSVWFLLGVSAGAFTAMGLTIANVSIIYRLRYAFMMLMIILGLDGARRLISLLKSSKTTVAASAGINTRDPIAL